MPYPSNRQWLALGVEVTRGTAAAPTWYFPVKAPVWTPNVLMLEDLGMRGDMNAEHDQVAGPRTDSLEFDCDVYTDTFPALARAALGSLDVVTGAGPYLHTLKLLNTGQGQPPSYSGYYFDSLDVNEILGMQLDTMVLTYNATGLLSAKTKFIGNPATIGSGTPTYSAESAVPAWNATVSLGGSAITKLVSGEFNLARGTKPIPAITGTQAYYQNWAGPLTTKSSKMTVIMESDAELNYYLSNTKTISLDCKWTNAADSTWIDLHYSTMAFAVGHKNAGKEWMEVDLEFWGIPNATDGTPGPLTFTASNSQSTLYEQTNSDGEGNMRRIELPGGAWADVREAADLKVRHKHLLEAATAAGLVAIGKLPNLPFELPTDPMERAELLKDVDMDVLTANGVLTFEEAQTLTRIQEITVVAFLAAWSLPDPLPTPATVGDMDPAIYDAIAAATKSDGAAAIQGLDLDPNPYEDVAGNPTGRDSDSAGPSEMTTQLWTLASEPAIPSISSDG